MLRILFCLGLMSYGLFTALTVGAAEREAFARINTVFSEINHGR